MPPRSGRYLLPEKIPDTLLDRKDRALLIPPIIASAGRRIISRVESQFSVGAPRRSGAIGGVSEEDAAEHLTERFWGSSARAELATLDPDSILEDVSDVIIRSLAQGELCLVDTPCGAGAASLTILDTIAELRRHDILPREPLYVSIVAADASPSAMRYAEEIAEDLKQSLEEQAIFLTVKFCEWDILDKVSTADLIAEVVKIDRRVLLLIANFSGFLQQKHSKAKAQLENLFLFSSQKEESAAVWIEPNTRKATGHHGILPVVIGLIERSWQQFIQWTSGNRERTAESHFVNPSTKGRPKVRIAVLNVRLSRRGQDA